MKKQIMAMSSAIAMIGLAACGGNDAPSSVNDNTNQASVPEQCNIIVSDYTGWFPMLWAEEAGYTTIAGELYGLNVGVQHTPNYGASIELFASDKDYDALVITNMDALIAPASSGIKTSFYPTSTSNGNDALMIVDSTNSLTLEDALNSGEPIYLLEGTVAAYLVAQAAESVGIDYSSLNIVNADEDAIVAKMATGGDGTMVAIWNPFKMSVEAMPNVQVLFDSSEIAGQIIDGIIVRDSAPEGCGAALLKSFYAGAEDLVTNRDAAVAYMSKKAGASVAEFESQLATTNMIGSLSDAIEFINDSEVIDTMESVYEFSRSQNLLSEDVSVTVGSSPSPIGSGSAMLSFDDAALTVANIN